jgi:hypothetical protein
MVYGRQRHVGPDINVSIVSLFVPATYRLARAFRQPLL